MKQIQLFNVAPCVPQELSFLETLAHNFWWCWNLDAIELFRRINPQLWRESSHNPLIFLASLPQRRLEQLPKEEGFMSHLASVKSRFEKSVLPSVDCDAAKRSERCIAYLSLEFGIHESLRFYSGGLGGLAGDHLKSASDLNIPLVGIGLFYRQGYFQQMLNNDGWQQETYPENELHHMPLSKALDNNGQPVQVTIPLPEGPLKAIVWRLDVGRVPLYMMDTNIQENNPEFRRITAQLYSGDRKMRLRQELLLGIGGYRALHALGYDPHVIHMNEGHAAFVSLPRLTHLIKDLGMDKKSALQVVNRTSIFTTHTPVPAGNETFDIGLLRPHLETLRHELGLEPDEIISWGQAGDGQPSHETSMTILGLRMARSSNGVSELHGRVARNMWKHLWPECPEDEVPIIHITNGVHVSSWLSPDNAALFDRYLGTDWREKAGDEESLAHLAHIPDEEIWRAHELGRSRLVRVSREIMENALRHRNGTKAEVAHAKSILDQGTLTIGFARRFATYKRGNLLLRDPERIIALLTNADRPVQLVFAGKSHPADDAGKDFIRQIVHFARKANLSRRIVFLENYDIYVARTMVQGVDVWLNTPRRPQEASGTSGMKAALNGALHLSVLDGWWCEGYKKENGWAIGHGEEYDDPNYQDTVESLALYNLLENEVIPTYYDRQASDLSLRWVKMMKASMSMALGYFSSHRMVNEYSSLFYKPAKAEYNKLTADNHKHALALVKQNERLASLWHRIKLTMPVVDRDISSLHVGDTFTVNSTVHLVDLQPDEVEVQIYYGPVNSENQILESHVYPMTQAEDLGNGRYMYRHNITCKISGRYAFSARVTPAGSDWKGAMPGYITWAAGTTL